MTEEIIIFGKDGCKEYSSPKLFLKAVQIRKDHKLRKNKEVKDV